MMLAAFSALSISIFGCSGHVDETASETSKDTTVHSTTSAKTVAVPTGAATRSLQLNHHSTNGSAHQVERDANVTEPPVKPVVSVTRAAKASTDQAETNTPRLQSGGAPADTITPPSEPTKRFTPDDGSWQEHPAWDLISDGKLVDALRWFDRDLSALDESKGLTEFGDGLSLGRSVTTATLACNTLRALVKEVPASDAGTRARRLLELLHQTDRPATHTRRQNTQRPWCEALGRLMEIYPAPNCDMVFSVPGIAVARDGTRFRWSRDISSGRPIRGPNVHFGIFGQHPDGHSTFCEAPGSRVFSSFIMSPDTKRFFVSQARQITCLDADIVKSGEWKTRWTFTIPVPKGGLRYDFREYKTPASVAVLDSGRKLAWGQMDLGSGILDTDTGELLADSLSDRESLAVGTPWENGFEVCTETAASISALNVDGSRVYLPIRSGVIDKRATSAGDRVTFGRVTGWVELDASSGDITGFRADPWKALDSDHRGRTVDMHGTRHGTPLWCPGVAPRTAFCVTDDGYVILVNHDSMSIIGITDTVVNWPGVRLRIPFTKVEYKRTLMVLRQLSHPPTDVDGSLVLMRGGTPLSRYCAAVGFLLASATGPALRTYGGRELVLDPIEKDGLLRFMNLPSTMEAARYFDRLGWLRFGDMYCFWFSRVMNNAYAWRGIWRAYLHYPEAEIHEPLRNGQRPEPLLPTITTRKTSLQAFK